MNDTNRIAGLDAGVAPDKDAAFEPQVKGDAAPTSRPRMMREVDKHLALAALTLLTSPLPTTDEVADVVETYQHLTWLMRLFITKVDRAGLEPLLMKMAAEKLGS